MSFTVSIRDHAAREQQRNKREAHEAIFVPKLTADPPSKAAISATSSGLQLLDDLMEDALECPVLVIEQPSVSPSLKILTQFHKKPCTLDVLNKDLKERSKSSVKAAPVESKQSPAIPGSDYDDDLDKTEIGYEVYSDLGSDEYADDNLLDAGAGSASEETFDEEEASDLESEAHKTHGIVLTDEEGDDVVLRRKHSVMPILDSDLDQPDRRAEDPTTNSSDEEEALLNLLSGEFAANLAESKSKSRFVDDEADEEDEMGNLVLNSADRNDDVDRQHLVQELRGMIDDKATSITDDTKKLYVQQLVEDDLNEANEMLTLLQSKKKRRAEEKTLRKLIKSRTTFKNTPFITSDTSNAPVSFNEFEEIFSFDKKDTGHVLDPTFVSETGGPMHPIQFSRSSHYVENTNLYSNIRGRAKVIHGKPSL